MGKIATVSYVNGVLDTNVTALDSNKCVTLYDLLSQQDWAEKVDGDELGSDYSSVYQCVEEVNIKPGSTLTNYRIDWYFDCTVSELLGDNVILTSGLNPRITIRLISRSQVQGNIHSVILVNYNFSSGYWPTYNSQGTGLIYKGVPYYIEVEIGSIYRQTTINNVNCGITVTDSTGLTIISTNKSVSFSPSTSTSFTGRSTKTYTAIGSTSADYQRLNVTLKNFT